MRRLWPNGPLGSRVTHPRKVRRVHQAWTRAAERRAPFPPQAAPLGKASTQGHRAVSSPTNDGCLCCLARWVEARRSVAGGWVGGWHGLKTICPACQAPDDGNEYASLVHRSAAGFTVSSAGLTHLDGAVRPGRLCCAITGCVTGTTKRRAAGSLGSGNKADARAAGREHTRQSLTVDVEQRHADHLLWVNPIDLRLACPSGDGCGDICHLNLGSEIRMEPFLLCVGRSMMGVCKDHQIPPR